MPSQFTIGTHQTNALSVSPWSQFRYPIAKVPKEWKKAPVWLSIQSKLYPRCKAKVLVAFELVPADLAENGTYPFYDDIRPSTKEATVALFLVGIRLFSPLNRPYIDVGAFMLT